MRCQTYTLFPWLTVLQNVMFGLEVSRGFSTITAKSEAQEWIELVGLTDFAELVSAPALRRHEAARGDRPLANRPRILLMDEPFSALDAQTRAQMQSYLLQIWRQVDITIVFITHDLDEAIYLAYWCWFRRHY